MNTVQSRHDALMRDGYLVVENVLSENQIEALVADYTDLLSVVAPELYAAGKIPSAFKHLPFDKRMAAVLGEARENLYGHFDITLPNGDITEDTPIHLSRPVFEMIKSPRILDVIEELIGGEIYASPIQHVRIKPPQAIVERNKAQSSLAQLTGWHQDQGVAREESDETAMITVWLAITDATLENGCLQVIPRSHCEGIVAHCPTGAQMVIPDTLLNGEPKPIPLKAGSALLLHRMTKHASLSNVSDSIRWSFDLRYQPIGQPTGRDELPGMIVRSRRNPERVQGDYEVWIESWREAKAQLVAQGEREKLHRWDGNAAVCA